MESISHLYHSDKHAWLHLRLQRQNCDRCSSLFVTELSNVKCRSANLRETMLPSSAGRLLILLDDRSKYTRLWSLAMSGGMRDNELSLRCRTVRWVKDHRAVLRLRTLPAARDRTYQWSKTIISLSLKKKNARNFWNLGGLITHNNHNWRRELQL